MSQKSENQKKKYKRSPALTASIILVFLSIVLLLTLAMFTSFDEVTNRLESGKVDIVLEEHHWKSDNADEIVPNTFVDKDPTIRNKDETVNTYVFLEVIVPYDDDPNLVIEKAYQDGTDDSTNKAGEKVYPAGSQENNKKIPYYKFIPTGKKIDEAPGEVIKLSGYTDEELYGSTQKINDASWKLLDLGTNGNPKIDESSKTFTYIYAYVRATDHTKLEQLPPNTAVETPLFNKIYLLNFRERKEVKDNQGCVIQTAFPDPARDYSIRVNAYGIQANFLKPNNLTTDVPEEVWAMLDKSYTYTAP